MIARVKLNPAALGLAEDEGEVLADGEMDAEGDWDADGLAEAEGDSDDEGETDAEADGDSLGLIDGDTDADGDTEADGEGDTDADGDSDGEPIAATSIVAHTFTPLVASLNSENVWTQNSYSPTASAGQRNRASLSASGVNLAGESVCTPPGSVTYSRAYCPPGA